MLYTQPKYSQYFAYQQQYFHVQIYVTKVPQLQPCRGWKGVGDTWHFSTFRHSDWGTPSQIPNIIDNIQVKILWNITTDVAEIRKRLEGTYIAHSLAATNILPIQFILGKVLSRWLTFRKKKCSFTRQLLSYLRLTLAFSEKKSIKERSGDEKENTSGTCTWVTGNLHRTSIVYCFKHWILHMQAKKAIYLSLPSLVRILRYKVSLSVDMSVCRVI